MSKNLTSKEFNILYFRHYCLCDLYIFIASNLIALAECMFPIVLTSRFKHQRFNTLAQVPLSSQQPSCRGLVARPSNFVFRIRRIIPQLLFCLLNSELSSWRLLSAQTTISHKLGQNKTLEWFQPNFFSFRLYVFYFLYCTFLRAEHFKNSS